MKNGNIIHFWLLFVVSSLWLSYCNLVSAESDPNFPFRIERSRFVRKSDDKPVFLNIIGYQPFEPGQNVNSEIREKRIKDDLRRWRAYEDGTDPIVLRVYPGPTKNDPNRMMPKIFYDGVCKLGFWVIRDIYFDPNCADPNARQEGHNIIDAVLAEVNDANGFNRIFAWEIGDELEAPYDGNEAEIKGFVEDMCGYLKQELSKLNVKGVSDWVAWASWAANDPLHTAGGPIEPNCLDYISYNAYSYDPERMRDHQSGPTTGTPYQGYLAALKKCYPNKPVVISETGLADNNCPEDIGDHARLHPWYPTYRKGGLASEQVAEALADRYWDARLLRDEEDPNIVIAGLAIFEWNDEWWKFHNGNDANQENKPEEHFGLGRFEEKPEGDEYQLRHKLQQETIRDLFTLKFRNDPATLGSSTTKTAILSEPDSINDEASEGIDGSMRYRWEVSRGYIIGDGASSEFYPSKIYLGPAKITTVSIDANSYADVSSSTINLEPPGPNSIEILTLGVGAHSNDISARASGCVANVNLDEYKLVCYLYHRYDVNGDDRDWCKYDAQPYQDRYSPTGKGMKSIWVDKNGYWWTEIFHDPNDPGELYCWLVHKSWGTIDYMEGFDLVWSPPQELTIAEANTVGMDPNDYNDVDNDLLPDKWERNHFGSIDANDRYDDPDKDGANNLEEFLAGTSPIDANDPNGNDTDGDGLWDNWERRFFGRLIYDANSDPDSDGLSNLDEFNLGLHPGRTTVDEDRDKLPDLWEVRWFGSINIQDANDNPDFDDCNNLYEYEVGLNPNCDIVANFNCDCIVDWYDLKIFQTAWLSTPDDPNWNSNCDIFEPNDINFKDFAIFAKNWLVEL